MRVVKVAKGAAYPYACSTILTATSAAQTTGWFTARALARHLAETPLPIRMQRGGQLQSKMYRFMHRPARAKSPVRLAAPIPFMTGKILAGVTVSRRMQIWWAKSQWAAT